jgi:hypothetical protein
VCGSGAVVSTWSLLIRGAQRARRQAEIPLIGLCRIPGPALFLIRFKIFIVVLVAYLITGVHLVRRDVTASA